MTGHYLFREVQRWRDVWWVMLEDPRVKEVEKLAEVFGEESTTLMGLLPVGQFWPTEEQVLKAIAFCNYIPEDKVRMLCEKARRPAPMTNEKFRRGTASPNPAPNPDEAHD